MNILTTVYNNGIVNQVQIKNFGSHVDNKTQTQLIWNGHIHCVIFDLNERDSVFDEDNVWSIKNYRAIYLNGILIVKNGRVWPRKRFWHISKD